MMLLSCTKMAKRQKNVFIKPLSIYIRITSMTRINDYIFGHVWFPLFPVTYIFGDL